MFENRLFKRFCRERNLKESTSNGYESAMKNVMINVPGENDVKHQEFTIVINVFLSGKEYNIL